MGRSTGGTREHRWLAHGFLVLTRLATAGLRSRVPGGIIVDLLFASSGIEPEITAAAEVLTVARGLRMPVARTGHLIALKLL